VISPDSNIKIEGIPFCVISPDSPTMKQLAHH
jgi:hypothetical protein